MFSVGTTTLTDKSPLYFYNKLCYNKNNDESIVVFPTLTYTMSLIKEELFRRMEEEDELWNSYMEWIEDNKEHFSHLKNLVDLSEEV